MPWGRRHHYHACRLSLGSAKTNAALTSSDCRESARGRSGRRLDVTVHAPQPALTDEVADERVGPVPLPGEPAPQFGLGCDNRRVHAGGDQVLERTGGTRAALAAAGVGLVPARQLARMRV